MSRLPYAATQLIDQVHAHEKRDATATQSGVATGFPDGLDVQRAIYFDKVTAKWLEPALRACADPRISGMHKDKAGLVVVFVPDTRSDYAHPFEIDEALRVLEG